MSAQALTPHAAAASSQLCLDLSGLPEPSSSTMLRDLVRAVISLYSNPGDLVLDPSCGTGNTLTEAVHLDRDAIGIESEPRLVSVAAANLCRAREQGAPAHGIVLREDARRLGHGLLDELAGRAALAITFCDCDPDGERLSWPTAPGAPASRTLTDLLTACRRLLAAGGFLALLGTGSDRFLERHDQVEEHVLEAGFELHDRLDAIPRDTQGAKMALRASIHQVNT